MADELHLSAGLDSLIAASFFLGYFFFQIPGTIYAEQRSARLLSPGRRWCGDCSPWCRAC